MTEKLFYKSSYMKEFQAVITDSRPDGEQYRVILDRTAFFPEGGGQSGDRGWLNGIRVLDTQEEGGNVYHVTEAPMDPGTQVSGVLDFSERFSKMQQHTGEHIVSGLINRHFGYQNVGFHLGKEAVTMDFNGLLTQEQLRMVEREANEAAVSNLPVQVDYPDRKVLEKIAYRSKIEILGQVRIVTIPGYDVCACCAPHVERTGEIGVIKLTGSIKYKGGTRVSMLCGFRALEDYNKKEENIARISAALSAKPLETAEAVDKLKGEVQKQKDRLIRLQKEYLEEKLMQIGEQAERAVIFEEELDRNAARGFVNSAIERSQGLKLCGVFTGNDSSGYSYLFGSRTEDMRELARGLHARFSGKGGGKKEMVQGSVPASKEELEKYFNAL